mgnify:CR=1 FL=1
MKKQTPSHKLALLGLSALFSSPFCSAALVANWTMDDADVSGNTVSDVAGSNDGTLTNGATTGAPSPFGQAANFDGGANNGDNPFIDLSAAVSNLALPSGTIAAWIKPETQAGDVLTIFSVSNASIGTGEARFFVSNGGGFGTGNLTYGVRGASTNGNVVSSGIDLFDGAWHHVAVTVDSLNAVTLYIDGTANGTGTADFLDLPGANSVSIGRNKDNTAGGGQWFYHGLIDEVQIHDEPLSAAQISSLASVPEPSSALLMSLSALALLIRHRR